MYNWSTNLTRLQKNPEQFEIYQLEQSINFGLNGKKISKQLLKKHWNELQLDPSKKTYLEWVLWPKS